MQNILFLKDKYTKISKLLNLKIIRDISEKVLMNRTNSECQKAKSIHSDFQYKLCLWSLLLVGRAGLEKTFSKLVT